MKSIHTTRSGRGSPPPSAQALLEGRIRNTRKLLKAAALIMCVLLISSSIVTTLLIPPEEFSPETDGHEAGEANGRALAYLAHTYLGDVFGTIYDLSTISILWFAGSSALAGLLNIIPRYLPRYGMAPDWAQRDASADARPHGSSAFSSRFSSKRTSRRRAARTRRACWR